MGVFDSIINYGAETVGLRKEPVETMYGDKVQINALSNADTKILEPGIKALYSRLRNGNNNIKIKFEEIEGAPSIEANSAYGAEVQSAFSGGFKGLEGRYKIIIEEDTIDTSSQEGYNAYLAKQIYKKDSSLTAEQINKNTEINGKINSLIRLGTSPKDATRIVTNKYKNDLKYMPDFYKDFMDGGAAATMGLFTGLADAGTAFTRQTLNYGISKFSDNDNYFSFGKGVERFNAEMTQTNGSIASGIGSGVGTALGFIGTAGLGELAAASNLTKTATGLRTLSGAGYVGLPSLENNILKKVENGQEVTGKDMASFSLDMAGLGLNRAIRNLGVNSSVRQLYIKSPVLANSIETGVFEGANALIHADTITSGQMFSNLITGMAFNTIGTSNSMNVLNGSKLNRIRERFETIAADRPIKTKEDAIAIARDMDNTKEFKDTIGVNSIEKIVTDIFDGKATTQQIEFLGNTTGKSFTTGARKEIDSILSEGEGKLSESFRKKFDVLQNIEDKTIINRKDIQELNSSSKIDTGVITTKVEGRKMKDKDISLNNRNIDKLTKEIEQKRNELDSSVKQLDLLKGSKERDAKLKTDIEKQVALKSSILKTSPKDRTTKEIQTLNDINKNITKLKTDYNNETKSIETRIRRLESQIERDNTNMSKYQRMKETGYYELDNNTVKDTLPEKEISKKVETAEEVYRDAFEQVDISKAINKGGIKKVTGFISNFFNKKDITALQEKSIQKGEENTFILRNEASYIKTKVKGGYAFEPIMGDKKKYSKFITTQEYNKTKDVVFKGKQRDFVKNFKSTERIISNAIGKEVLKQTNRINKKGKALNKQLTKLQEERIAKKVYRDFRLNWTNAVMGRVGDNVISNKKLKQLINSVENTDIKDSKTFSNWAVKVDNLLNREIRISLNKNEKKVLKDIKTKQKVVDTRLKAMIKAFNKNNKDTLIKLSKLNEGSKLQIDELNSKLVRLEQEFIDSTTEVGRDLSKISQVMSEIQGLSNIYKKYQHINKVQIEKDNNEFIDSVVEDISANKEIKTDTLSAVSIQLDNIDGTLSVLDGMGLNKVSQELIKYQAIEFDLQERYSKGTQELVKGLYDNNISEAEFMIYRHYKQSKNNLIDSDGNRVESFDNKIVYKKDETFSLEKNNYKKTSDGNYFNKEGKIVDKDGHYLDENGKKEFNGSRNNFWIDKDGNFVDSELNSPEVAKDLLNTGHKPATEIDLEKIQTKIEKIKGNEEGVKGISLGESIIDKVGYEVGKVAEMQNLIEGKGAGKISSGYAPRLVKTSKTIKAELNNGDNKIDTFDKVATINKSFLKDRFGLGKDKDFTLNLNMGLMNSQLSSQMFKVTYNNLLGNKGVIKQLANKLTINGEPTRQSLFLDKFVTSTIKSRFEHGGTGGKIVGDITTLGILSALGGHPTQLLTQKLTYISVSATDPKIGANLFSSRLTSGDWIEKNSLTLKQRGQEATATTLEQLNEFQGNTNKFKETLMIFSTASDLNTTKRVFGAAVDTYTKTFFKENNIKFTKQKGKEFLEKGKIGDKDFSKQKETVINKADVYTSKTLIQQNAFNRSIFAKSMPTVAMIELFLKKTALGDVSRVINYAASKNGFKNPFKVGIKESSSSAFNKSMAVLAVSAGFILSGMSQKELSGLYGIANIEASKELLESLDGLEEDIYIGDTKLYKQNTIIGNYMLLAETDNVEQRNKIKERLKLSNQIKDIVVENAIGLIPFSDKIVEQKKYGKGTIEQIAEGIGTIATTDRKEGATIALASALSGFVPKVFKPFSNIIKAEARNQREYDRSNKTLENKGKDKLTYNEWLDKKENSRIEKENRDYIQDLKDSSLLIYKEDPQKYFDIFKEIYDDKTPAQASSKAATYLLSQGEVKFGIDGKPIDNTAYRLYLSLAKFGNKRPKTIENELATARFPNSVKSQKTFFDKFIKGVSKEKANRIIKYYYEIGYLSETKYNKYIDYANNIYYKK